MSVSPASCVQTETAKYPEKKYIFETLDSNKRKEYKMDNLL